MNNNLFVKNLDTDTISTSDYDLFICALGYEARSLKIARSFKPRANVYLADAFKKNKLFDYERNSVWLSKSNYEIYENEDIYNHKWRLEFLKKIISKKKTVKKGTIKIAFDVSSLSRIRIASWFRAFILFSSQYNVEVDFIYTFGTFYNPIGKVIPIIHYGPVTPYFSGWTNDPNKPVCLIFGIGFEPNRAIGVWEFLESPTAFAFVPKGPSYKFDREIKASNSSLWKQFEYTQLAKNIINYKYDEPYKSYLFLESLINGCKRKTRPIIIPFGPKIFSIISLFVGYIHLPEVAVWRVSGGVHEEPINRKPGKKVVGIKSIFTK